MKSFMSIIYNHSLNKDAMSKKTKWISANELQKMAEIKIGDAIMLYGRKTTVIGFYVTFNEALDKWETIIETTDRGDPFERSSKDIKIYSPH